MTFGLIGNLLGPVAEILGYRKASQSFIPKYCPVLHMGEQHLHLLHTLRGGDKETAFMLNTLVDFVLIIIQSNGQQSADIEWLKTKAKSISKRVLALTEEQARSSDERMTGALERMEKKLRAISKKAGKADIMESLEKMSSSLDDFDTKLEAASNARVLESLTKRLKEQEKMIKEVVDEVKNIAKSNRQATLDNIKEDLGKAFQKQNKKIAGDIADLQEGVKELLKEVKFDPDNPKPTEIRTEENSNQILRLTKDMMPMLEESKKAIQTSNELLGRLAKRLT